MSTKIRRDETDFGYYDDAAREYVVTDPRTPTKWVNYIGTLDFGGFVDQTGGLNICKKDPATGNLEVVFPQAHLMPRLPVVVETRISPL